MHTADIVVLERDKLYKIASAENKAFNFRSANAVACRGSSLRSASSPKQSPAVILQLLLPESYD